MSNVTARAECHKGPVGIDEGERFCSCSPGGCCGCSSASVSRTPCHRSWSQSHLPGPLAAGPSPACATQGGICTEGDGVSHLSRWSSRSFWGVCQLRPRLFGAAPLVPGSPVCVLPLRSCQGLCGRRDTCAAALLRELRCSGSRCSPQTSPLYICCSQCPGDAPAHALPAPPARWWVSTAGPPPSPATCGTVPRHLSVVCHSVPACWPPLSA